MTPEEEQKQLSLTSSFQVCSFLCLRCSSEFCPNVAFIVTHVNWYDLFNRSF